AVMSYVPTGNALSRYAPSASETAVRMNPVAAFLPVTVTPGTAAPCASVTRPWMLPVVCCPAARFAVAHTSNRARMILFILSVLPGRVELTWNVDEQDESRGEPWGEARD